MEIKYFGHSAFYIKTKTGRLVTDPFDPKMVGLKFPKVEADVVTLSHQHSDHNYRQAVGGEPVVFDWPGQFEKNGISVYGWSSFHDAKKGAERGENIIYKIESEGINIVHCGDLGVVPDDQFLEDLGDIDILMLPVGGVYTINPKEAVTLARHLEPAIIIPMHYRTDNHDEKAFGQLATVEKFIKTNGQAGPEPIDKLVIKKDDLLNEEMKLVVMRISS